MEQSEHFRPPCNVNLQVDLKSAWTQRHTQPFPFTRITTQIHQAWHCCFIMTCNIVDLRWVIILHSSNVLSLGRFLLDVIILVLPMDILCDVIKWYLFITTVIDYISCVHTEANTLQDKDCDWLAGHILCIYNSLHLYSQICMKIPKHNSYKQETDAGDVWQVLSMAANCWNWWFVVRIVSLQIFLVNRASHWLVYLRQSHVLAYLCDSACKRPLAICFKRRVLCLGRRPLPMQPVYAEQRL